MTEQPTELRDCPECGEEYLATIEKVEHDRGFWMPGMRIGYGFNLRYTQHEDCSARYWFCIECGKKLPWGPVVSSPTAGEHRKSNPDHTVLPYFLGMTQRAMASAAALIAEVATKDEM